MYAVKQPSGKLVTSSVREDYSECIDDFVLMLTKSGQIIEDQSLFGPTYLYDVWVEHFISQGYAIVTCVIEQHSDGVYGWPELVETPRQEPLFKSETLIRSQ